jgi:2-dehydropantoate 2-reductase
MDDAPIPPGIRAGGQARLSVAVIGLGSIGGVAAGCLLAAGRHDVVACVRQRLERLTLERPEGTVELELRSMTDPAPAAPVDWVLLCTKSHDTPSAAPWLARLCRPSTRVAVLQNGVDHVSRVSPLTAGATVVPVIVYYNGERLATDRVRLRHVRGPDLAVPDDAAGHAFASLLEGSGLSVAPNADFTTLLWRKLLINSVANPLTALTRQRQMVLRRDDMRALCLSVLEEAAAVGRAEGARLAPDAPQLTLAALFSVTDDLGTSMYFDTLAGRRLEVEALTGAIVAAGERHGIATPLNRALLALLRAISDGGAASGASAFTPGSLT